MLPPHTRNTLKSFSIIDWGFIFASLLSWPLWNLSMYKSYYWSANKLYKSFIPVLSIRTTTGTKEKVFWSKPNFTFKQLFVVLEFPQERGGLWKLLFNLFVKFVNALLILLLLVFILLLFLLLLLSSYWTPLA